MFKKLLLTPQLWLGLGIGIFAGIAFAADLRLDREDASRFTGSMLGALIAVAGAITLYYLKDRDEELKRRSHLLSMLQRYDVMLAGMPNGIQAGDGEAVSAGIRVSSKYLKRLVAYCSSHESDDLIITNVAMMLDNLHPDLFLKAKQSDDDYTNPELAELIEESVKTFREVVADCIAEIEAAKK